MRLCVGASKVVKRILRRPAGDQTPIVQILVVTFTARLTWKITEVEFYVLLTVHPGTTLGK